MAPPFIAYYGVATNNATVLKAAVDQCLLYQQALRANTTSVSPHPPSTHPVSAAGLWIHILGPVNSDPGTWSTGNGWAAAGAMRILATLVKAPAALFKAHTITIAQWRAGAGAKLVGVIRGILEGAMRASPNGGLLLNYVDDASWCGEISGSTLLASVVYHLAALSNAAPLGAPLISSVDAQRYVAWAEKIRTTMGTHGHVTANGTATPAVNPLGWGDRSPWTAGSPEGQNFVVLMTMLRGATLFRKGEGMPRLGRCCSR